jgi:hypothetical protein
LNPQKRRWENLKSGISRLGNFTVAVVLLGVPRKYRELSDEGRERAKVIRIVQKGKWEMLQHLLLCACHPFR